MSRWIRLSGFALLVWIMACGCSLGTQPTVPTSQPVQTAIVFLPTQTPTPTKTNIPVVATAFPTQIPGPTAIPLPVIPNRGSYGNSCVAMPAQSGGTVNVRVGAGTNYDVIALLQTWAVVVTSQGTWYAISLPRGLTRYEVGWVSSTVTTISAGCNPPTPTPSPTENTTCRFNVGGNVTSVNLYAVPNGPYLATVPTQILRVLAQQGNWFQVISSVTGQIGWLPDTQGFLLGNCAGIPQVTAVPQGVTPTTEPQACLITVGIDSPVYSAPNVPSTDSILAGGTIRAVVRTSDGWYGYKVGLTTYDGSDLKTFKWVPYGNPLGNVNNGTTGCNTLTTLVYPTS